MYLMEILERESGILEKILRGHNLNTTRCISETCKTFNKIIRNDMIRYYREYSKILIPKLFENTVKIKMSTIYYTRDDTDTINECDIMLINISHEINKKNFEEILERLLESYYNYLFKTIISNGDDKTIYRYILLEYENFLREIMNYDVNDVDYGVGVEYGI